jgi:hypothetical protein
MNFSNVQVWRQQFGGFSSCLMMLLLMLGVPNAFGTDFGPANSADVGPPNSIVVDTLNYQKETGFGNVSYHAGQVVQYRVRYYGANGRVAPCNPGGTPQVLTHNPMSGKVINSWTSAPAGGDASGVVNVVMGAAGAASFEVSCGTSVKRVLVSSDGEPLTASEQAQNDKFVQDAGLASQVTASPGLAGQAPAPAPAASGGMSPLTTAAIIAGAALTVGAVVAVAASAGSSTYGGSSSGSGGNYYYANYNCNGSSQCASVMGYNQGSAGPFCTLSSCQAWLSTYFAGGNCTTSPTYTITNNAPPPCG